MGFEAPTETPVVFEAVNASGQAQQPRRPPRPPQPDFGGDFEAADSDELGYGEARVERELPEPGTTDFGAAEAGVDEFDQDWEDLDDTGGIDVI